MANPKTAWELLNRIPDYGVREKLERDLQQMGGWRALFDTISHEWTLSTPDQKMRMIGRIMQATGVTLGDILIGFQNDYGKDRPDILLRLPFALAELLEHAIGSNRVIVPD